MGWLTAAQALSVLRVRPQTLYANVSRRRIRARPDPKDPRRSLYHEADVNRLARGRSGTRKAERVAAGTIEWGDPILSSGISTVAHGRLWYRGQDVAALAQTRTLEEVACLLWDAPSVNLAEPAARGISGQRRRSGVTRMHPTALLPRMFIALGERAGRDPPSHGRALSALRSEAAGVLTTVAETVAGERHKGRVHERLAAAWRCRSAADLLRRVLVLLADHELNASTFAARVTVSTGASLAAAVLAGLATLSGPLHGRASWGVFELISVGRRQGMQAAVREWLAQGRPLSGFGHPLYPDGDVRARALLAEFAAPIAYRELSAAVEELAGELPNIDFAVAALTEACRLPRDAPLALFALARSVGWLAHALEHVSTGHLIRPRARYSGPPIVAVPSIEPDRTSTVIGAKKRPRSRRAPE
ncbi:MAG: citrate synthase [Steroidobacteraceae bacterium]